MSPVSRNRKRKKKSAGGTRLLRPVVVDKPEACDCPACSGNALDPSELAAGLTTGMSDVLNTSDPLNAETAAATFLAIAAAADEQFEDAVINGMIPEFEATGSSESLALLAAIGSIAGGEISGAARAAADRLTKTDVAIPGWISEFDAPITVTDCIRLGDSDETGSAFGCVFHRAGRSHAMLMLVDHDDCDAAEEILLLDADQLPEVLQTLREGIERDDLRVTTTPLEPADLRWWFERALDARAVHDAKSASPPDTDSELPEYGAMATLLKARLTALPESDKPKAPHSGESDDGPGN